jgi:hypothetical protein
VLPRRAPRTGGTHGPRPSRSSALLLSACKKDISDDYLTAKAVCLNVTDPEEQQSCKDDAAEELNDGWSECFEVRDARNDVCDLIGPEAYDPDFDPASFATSFDGPSGNPFQPLTVGDHWEYGGAESVVVDVLDETKLIEGVTCATVRDEGFDDDVVTESTNDWIAVRDDGDAWYCGEISQSFEVFPGDDPETPELVDIEGSWKAGRDGAKPGLLVPADGAVDMTYRQEYAPSDAEDVATVVSRTYGYGNGEGLDEFVPQDLAELLCDGDCMVTREFTPLEPDALELKYYSPGIGLFLEVTPETGEIVKLVDCNMDMRCDDVKMLAE